MTMRTTNDGVVIYTVNTAQPMHIALLAMIAKEATDALRRYLKHGHDTDFHTLTRTAGKAFGMHLAVHCPQHKRLVEWTQGCVDAALKHDIEHMFDAFDEMRQWGEV